MIFMIVVKVSRNWVFATNSNFLISMFLQPDGVSLWYFKLRLFENRIHSLKYLRFTTLCCIFGSENMSLWQGLNSLMLSKKALKYFFSKLVFQWNNYIFWKSSESANTLVFPLKVLKVHEVPGIHFS